MKANVGTIDQAIRIMLGFLLVFLAGIGVVGMWGYVGVAFMATGAMRFCPAYRMFGITTCRARTGKR